MKNKIQSAVFNKLIPWLLTVIRIAIGWHFLYEGVAKIVAANWSSAPYLAGSKWIFAPIFTSMAESGAVTSVVDFLNIWGMILVGLGLIFGLFTRWASLGGAFNALLLFCGIPTCSGLYSWCSC